MCKGRIPPLLTGLPEPVKSHDAADSALIHSFSLCPTCLRTSELSEIRQLLYLDHFTFVKTSTWSKWGKCPAIACCLPHRLCCTQLALAVKTALVTNLAMIL